MSRNCSECGSDATAWDASIVNTTSVVDGRLRIHDLKVVFYFGCRQCSYTMVVIDADSPAGNALLNQGKRIEALRLEVRLARRGIR